MIKFQEKLNIHEFGGKVVSLNLLSNFELSQVQFYVRIGKYTYQRLNYHKLPEVTLELVLEFVIRGFIARVRNLGNFSKQHVQCFFSKFAHSLVNHILDRHLLERLVLETLQTKVDELLAPGLGAEPCALAPHCCGYGLSGHLLNLTQ